MRIPTSFNFVDIRILRDMASLINRLYDGIALPFSTVGEAVTASTTLDDYKHTAYVTTSGLTITLPECSDARIGVDWTIHLGTVGNVTIAPSAGDTIVLPTTDTTVALYNKGDSVTFRCMTNTTWGMV